MPKNFDRYCRILIKILYGVSNIVMTKFLISYLNSMILFEYIGLSTLTGPSTGLSTLKNFLKDHGENVKKLEFFPFIYYLLVNPTSTYYAYVRYTLYSY